MTKGVLLETLTEFIDAEWNNIKITFSEPWEIPWTVPPGQRDDYEIHFLEKGKGRFYIGGREYPVVKGDIVCLHSMEGNSFIADESPFRFMFVTFKSDSLNANDEACKLNDLLKNECFPIKPAETQKIRELFYSMHKEMSLKSESYLFRTRLFLGELALNLMDQCRRSDDIENIKFNANRNTHELINRVIIFLQDNYNRDIVLEDLGRLVNLHPRYLCTLFRQINGKTINGFLRELRIEKAKRLLFYTTLSITEIALETGFSSSQYFSRIFSQCTGIDPRSYRKSLNRLI